MSLVVGLLVVTAILLWLGRTIGNDTEGSLEPKQFDLIAREDFDANEVGYRDHQDGSARRPPSPPGDVTYIKALSSVKAGGSGKFVEVGDNGHL